VVTEGVNLFFRCKLTDVETCYQIFKRDLIAGMELDNNDFAFTVELAIKLVKTGHKIVEIPIKYFPRGRDEGKKLHWADGFVSLWTIFKYRFLK
jgi:hypothetical protein